MTAQQTDQPTGAVTSPQDPPMLAPPSGRFLDRRDAGRRLARLLERFREEHPVVVGIPRGGAPVAAEVARALDAPLDVALVRKLGAPQNPEYAIGALAEGGVQVLSRETVRMLGIPEAQLRHAIARVHDELDERLRRYRRGRSPVDLHGRTAILVDDGLATGRSAMAAIESLRRRGARRVILAVPVAAPDSANALRAHADEVVCVQTPADLWAVGYWYEDFAATGDEEVAELLASAARAPTGSPPLGSVPLQGVTIALGEHLLVGANLTVPAGAQAIVLFAHGSGSSRLSPRNRAVAQALNEADFATLLFDLLSPAEEDDRAKVFDVELLASRLVAASAWAQGRSELAGLPLAYFGASTGAAAALTAAAELGDTVVAVVSRGGRPDLARNLDMVLSPTLLVVGGADEQVLALNRAARQQLRCPSELAVVPGATHLFEEAGALEQVSRLAIDWLAHHLTRPERAGAA